MITEILSYVKNCLGCAKQDEYVKLDFSYLLAWINSTYRMNPDKDTGVELSFNIRKDRVIEFLNRLNSEPLHDTNPDTYAPYYKNAHHITIKQYRFDEYFKNTTIEDGMSLYQLMMIFSGLPRSGSFVIDDNNWVKYVNFKNTIPKVNATLIRTNVEYIPICSIDDYTIPEILISKIKKSPRDLDKKYCVVNNQPEGEDYSGRIGDLTGQDWSLPLNKRRKKSITTDSLDVKDENSDKDVKFDDRYGPQLPQNIIPNLAEMQKDIQDRMRELTESISTAHC